MGYALLLWNPKRRAKLGRGAIALILSEGLPCDALAKLPRARLEGTLAAMCGEDDDPAFLFSVDEKHIEIDVAWSKVETFAPKIVQFAKQANLEVYDPQREHTSREDLEVLEDAKRRAAAEVNEGAFERWRRRAEAGDAVAMTSSRAATHSETAWTRISVRRSSGTSGPRRLVPFRLYSTWRRRIATETGWSDPAQAVRLYEDLLVTEQRVSAFELGQRLEMGEGVPRSLQKAAEYYRLARANRHPEAYVPLKRIGFPPER